MPDNDVDVRYSPAWWMKVLTHQQSKKLNDNGTMGSVKFKPGLNTLNAWLENNPPLPPGAPSWLPAYQAFHASTRTNFASLVTSSASDRMTPLGFRTGASNDENGDELAHQVWTENEMPVEQVDLVYNMLGMSDAYMMIGQPPTGSDIPVLTAEDPRQIQTAHNPLRRTDVLAAIKTYHDPYEELDVCVVYIKGENGGAATAYEAYKPSSRGVNWNDGNSRFRFSPKAWSWREPVSVPSSRVPIVRFTNRRGVADFEPHITVLDRINRISLQRMLIGEMQSFRQRAIKGLPEVYPNDYPVAELRGKPIDYAGVFDPGPGSLWQVPEGVDFWESQPIDLRPLLDEERMEIRTLSGLTGMPVSYFNPDDANGSAEGASLQRESLIFRIEDRQAIVGVGLAQTLSIAFEMMGEQQRSEMSKIETIWAPIERLSLTERYQAAAAGRTAGLARDTIRREALQYTPRQLRMAADDDATETILTPIQVPSQRTDTARQIGPQQ